MKTIQRTKPIVVFFAMTCSLLITACSSLQISTQEYRQSIIDSRVNIITSNRLSNHSLYLLESAGLDEKVCFGNLQNCLLQLEKNQFSEQTPSQFALYAELYYARSQQVTDNKKCKQQAFCQQEYYQHLFEAIKHSYAYLFYKELTQNVRQHKLSGDLVDSLDIQTQDIYNTASEELISSLHAQISENIYATKTFTPPSRQQPQITFNPLSLGDYHLALSFSYQLFCPPFSCSEQLSMEDIRSYNTIDELFATSSLKMSGLHAVNKRKGIGVCYVAQWSGRHTQTTENRQRKTDKSLKNRIQTTGNRLLTCIIQPKGDNLQQVLSSKQFTLDVYEPYHMKTVKIRGRTYPLTINYSAPYALWLNENKFDDVSIKTMLSNDDDVQLPYLYMLEPFDPDRRVIIMVHGLASSPSTWLNVTNDILNDVKLRGNYQVWQVFYATNLPILDNRYYIQQLIEQAYKQSAGANNVPASKHSVLIGHSMGGVLSRMMLSDDDLNIRLAEVNQRNNPQFIEQDEQQIIDEKLTEAYYQGDYRQRLSLSALAPVDTAVFISAPFRGTAFADKWYTKILRGAVKLPAKLFPKILTDSKTEINFADDAGGALFLQNGADQLSDKSSFMRLTQNLKISPKVTYHTIMGSYRSKHSDGVVPHHSARLKGAKSETIFTGWHDIHTNPKTTQKLRQILREHVKQYPIQSAE